MGTVFVARSAALTKWGSDVGLGKFLFKLGFAEAGAEEAVKALNESAHAGATDWTLVRQQPAEDIDEDVMVARLGRKEKMVDPALYPRLRGATGIFKLKLANVENHILLSLALSGAPTPKVLKPKATDFAAYMVANALR